MGKRRSRRDHVARFIALPHWMLKCEAWMTMPPTGKAVLIHVWQRHNGSNNGQIWYSVRDAKEIGLSYPTAARALRICIERGFLVVMRDSAFTVKVKEARLWRLTAEPCNGEPATREFMCWTVSQNLKHSFKKPASQFH